MKRGLCSLLTIALALAAFSGALAVTEGDYIWNELCVTVTAIDTNPMFVPADMTDDQYAIAVRVAAHDALADDDEMLTEFLHQAKLVDADGRQYTVAASASTRDEVVLLYAVDRDVDADALSLEFIADAPGVPEEYIGQWAGSSGNISLWFTVEADGTGMYTFEQSGYSESYDFALLVDSETFLVDIPADNKLGIALCQGTYSYADGVLTLDICTSFAAGGEFTYAIACERAD